MRLSLALVLGLTAGHAAAQTLPLPFDDSVESQQVSVVVTPGRTSMKGLPPDLVRARQAMHAKEEVSDDDLRRLADSGDGLAAQRYVRSLIGQGKAVSQASDVAYYSALAVGAGRVWTLPDMIAALERLDRGAEPAERVNLYIKVLYAHAWEGNTAALDAVVALNGEGRLFGKLSDGTRQKILAQGEQNMDGKVELRMALALLEKESLTPEQVARLRGLLTTAAGSRHLGLMTTAQTLLTQVERDYPDGG